MWQERTWFRHLYGRERSKAGRKFAGRRGWVTRRYNWLFKGLELDLGGFLAAAAQFVEGGMTFSSKSHMSYLEDLTPDAMRFLARHGKSYDPIVTRERPIEEPRTAQCFENALRLARAKPKEVSYVEGLAMGPLAFPMLHAWNSFGTRSRKAMDWTFYATTGWSKYHGVALTFAEYRQLCRSLGVSENLNIFYRRNFSIRTKVHLQRVLAQRKRAGKKKRSRG